MTASRPEGANSGRVLTHDGALHRVGGRPQRSKPVFSNRAPTVRCARCDRMRPCGHDEQKSDRLHCPMADGTRRVLPRWMASEVGRLARLANSFRRPRTSPPADALSKLVVGRPLRARRPPSDSDRQPPGLTAAIEDVLVKVVAGRNFIAGRGPPAGPRQGIGYTADGAG